MKTLALRCLATAVLLSLAAAAHAASITQTVTVSQQTTDLNAAAFSNPISQFNAGAISAANGGAGVTLNDVILNLTVNSTTGGTLYNHAAQTQTFKYSETIGSFLDTPANYTVTSAAQQDALNALGDNGSENTLASIYGTQQYTLAPGASGTYPNKSAAGSQTLSASKGATLTDANSLNDFTGSGNFQLFLSTQTFNSFAGGGGNIDTLLTTTAGGNFTVRYDYTLIPNVPEPATWAMLGLGAAGAGVVAVRRRTC